MHSTKVWPFVYVILGWVCLYLTLVCWALWKLLEDQQKHFRPNQKWWDKWRQNYPQDSFFSKVVKEIVVFVPFVPSCLIKASVQNVEELPLSKKVHMTTVVSLLVSQTFTGTTAIAVLKKLASAWVFPSGLTNVLCMHVIASQVDLMLVDGLSTCWPGAAEFVCRTKGCLLVQLEKLQVILLKICWSWEKTALEWWQTVTWNLAAVGW